MPTRSIHDTVRVSQPGFVQTIQAANIQYADIDTRAFDSAMFAVVFGDIDEMGGSPQGAANIDVHVEHADDDGTGNPSAYGAASPTNFVTVAGQQSTDFVGDSETDDITDKSQTGWGSTLNVLRRGTVNCQGKADWPDTAGLDLVRTAWEGGLDIEGKLLLNTAGAHYVGFWQVTSFNVSGTHTTATEYNFTFQNNGALTYAAS